jgi:hypothetical protein
MWRIAGAVLSISEAVLKFVVVKCLLMDDKVLARSVDIDRFANTAS